MRKGLNRLVLALVGALLSVFFVLAPVVLVRRGFLHIGDHWQEVCFYILCIAGGGISAALGFSLRSGPQEIKRQRAVVWGSGIFFFLYLSCAVLCQKIHFGALDREWWRTLGVVLFVIGAALRLWAIAALGSLHSGFVTIQAGHQLIRSGPYRWLRHPSYLGGLIATVAIPPIFGSWFPLLAIPGALVALKWRIEDEEKLLSETFALEFEDYKKGTWRLIPFIY